MFPRGRRVTNGVRVASVECPATVVGTITDDDAPLSLASDTTWVDDAVFVRVDHGLHAVARAAPART